MSTGGKLWSDLTLMQELEDKLVSTGSIVDSKNMLVRGSESYTLPTNATFLDTEEPDKQVHMLFILIVKFVNLLACFY